ncbi:cupredoxin domain-containing protein [Streptomyces morookaense]|uniref:Cupredoxin family copper-binding protein n=1 Tax=Streptomyces morookaense TaxID=1970 RepID=A0A7Y7B9M8_STRMO|nr:cupredoxin family copper-binding protein [Streptomyces morookaense]NVK81384.1 cupredoxin family copper-binding protein [Streptomyces morookaense]
MRRYGSVVAALASAAVLAAAQTTYAATGQVAVVNYAYAPATLNVSRGTTVTWTNSDTAPHTVTSTAGSGGPLNSPMLNQGDSFSFTFGAAGTFSYYCTVHPTMKGTVVVS